MRKGRLRKGRSDFAELSTSGVIAGTGSLQRNPNGLFSSGLFSLLSPVVGVEGGQKRKSKLAFGTIENESGTSDFPPQGPKKESYVEIGTYKKNEKYTSGPSNSSPARPIYPQRVCLLYTSPSPRDPKTSRMPSSA